MIVGPCSVEHSDILAEAVTIPLESWNIHTFVVTDCFPGVGSAMPLLWLGLKCSSVGERRE